MAKLFFSYSHKDEALRDELEIHLSALKRQGIISTWHDRRIVGGEEFGNEISSHLEDADIILLLISPYFIDSDYCYEIEMKRAMEKHEKEESVVVPVILHPCDWMNLAFGKLIACPKDGNPISKFPNKHDAFLDVTQFIRRTVEKMAASEPEQLQIGSNNRTTETTKQVRFDLPRSSQLRLKKKFTDQEKDNFIIDAFEYMAKYFEGSLNELKKRNDNIDVNFRRVDSNRFSAKIYDDGKEARQCNIWLSDGNSFTSGILYSENRYSPNSYNESLNVEFDDYQIYLKPLGMRLFHEGRDQKMTFEGAAEYYWTALIGPLQ